jgi:SAM-dependent methyltransferase
MGLKGKIVTATNSALRLLGAELIRYAGDRKPWDDVFEKWIAEAEVSGQDPNDLGDVDWGDTSGKAFETYYFSFINPESVVLELGPGSGRVTRHLIGRCGELILVDYSQAVCDWLARYLKGKGSYRIIQIQKPSLAGVENGSVDTVIANGVFEHLDMDELFCFLQEFSRVLRPDGVISFNFDNIMSAGGMAWFKEYRGEPGSRSIFRFYHPESIRVLAHEAGLRVLDLKVDSGRIAHIILQKPTG